MTGHSSNEDALMRLAQSALFCAKLDQLWRKAKLAYPALDEKRIGQFGVFRCTHCGDPFLVGGDGRTIKTDDCVECE